jgi:hypothetical protein
VPSPDPAVESAAEFSLIGYLARQAGLAVDLVRIAGALSAHRDEQPLERVAATLPAAGLRADVCRMPLASALWQARASMPLIVHTPAAGWTVVVGGGLFRERVADFAGNSALPPPKPRSRPPSSPLRSPPRVSPGGMTTTTTGTTRRPSAGCSG